MFKIVVEPEAAYDIDQACNCYYSLPLDSQRLVDYFLNDLQEAFESLALNPYFQIKKKNYRALSLANFPHILFFTVDEIMKTITILSIFNTHQDTSKYPE